MGPQSRIVMDQYSITLEGKDQSAYFTVRWSPFIRLSKNRIRGGVPSEAGIFQLYSHRKASLELLGTYQAFYGGLRSTFLEILDEDCQIAFPDKEMLREEETYLRYSLSSSREDLSDILHHFTGSDGSGRFLEIMIVERDSLKIAR